MCHSPRVVTDRPYRYQTSIDIEPCHEKTYLWHMGWLVVLRLNVPVNNFSVILGRSHRFLGN